MKFLNRVLALAVLSFSVAGAVQAAAPSTLAAGGTNTYGSTFQEQSFGVGTTTAVGGSQLLNNYFSENWISSGGTQGFKGTLYSTVLTGDSNNPYGTGGKDFVYQLYNDGASFESLVRFVVNDFAGLNVSIGYVRYTESLPSFLNLGTFGPSQRAPTTVDRMNPPLANDKNIGFNFSMIEGAQGLLAPGERTPFLIVYTGNVSITTRMMTVQDGSNASVDAYAPTAAIPEPETYAMMLAGLGLMGFVARRRRGAKTAV